jgi:hypothetical protein
MMSTPIPCRIAAICDVDDPQSAREALWVSEMKGVVFGVSESDVYPKNQAGELPNPQAERLQVYNAGIVHWGQESGCRESVLR